MERNTEVAGEANRLYWRTDRSVADIAETLGVSRRALYELISADEAGALCDSCGGRLVFANRSARASGAARCADCGNECSITVEDAEPQDALAPYAGGWPHPGAFEELNGARRSLKIGMAALAGVAVGAVAVLLIARRR